MLQALLMLALAQAPSAPGLMWVREPHPEPLPTLVTETLAHAEVVTVYALNPMTPDSPPYTVGPGKPSPELFDIYPVLGKVRVTEPGRLREAASAILKGIQGPGAAACFYPRHGVRVEYAGRHIDFVMCFECHETVVVVGEGMTGRVTTDDSALAVLNAILKTGGVTALEPKSKMPK